MTTNTPANVVLEYLSKIGKIGGSKKTGKKAISSRKNGKKGGRPAKRAIEKNMAAVSLGSIKSAKKSLSSKKNGKLGGRPRKV